MVGLVGGLVELGVSDVLEQVWVAVESVSKVVGWVLLIVDHVGFWGSVMEVVVLMESMVLPGLVWVVDTVVNEVVISVVAIEGIVVLLVGWLWWGVPWMSLCELLL